MKPAAPKVHFRNPHPIAPTAGISYVSAMQKTLIIIGAIFIATGLLWPLISKLGLGKLPGDIAIKGDGFAFHFPITTMIVLSIVVTVLFRLFGK